MIQLNFNHLRYFHAIVAHGTLTLAAQHLHISQSALSIQLRKLEDALGCALFERKHKGLTLTEEGRMVHDYAQTIFRTGDELLATLENRGGRYRNVLRVGAVATLSKNFQINFLRQALSDEQVEVVIHSASMRVLLSELNAHTLDLVLANSPVKRDHDLALHCRLVDEQRVSLVGSPKLLNRKHFKFPDALAGVPLVLPSLESNIRASFDLLMEQAGIRPLIAAEVDDMAMLRLIARDMQMLALVPPVVVHDELKAGHLIEYCQLPDIHETFYAITATRRYPNPYLSRLLGEG